MKGVKKGILALNIKKGRNKRGPVIKIKDCNAFFKCFAKKKYKKRRLSDIFPGNGIWIENKIKENLPRQSFDFEGYLSDLGGSFRISAHRLNNQNLILVFTRQLSEKWDSELESNAKQLAEKNEKEPAYPFLREKEPGNSESLLNTARTHDKTISSFFSNASHETKTLLNGIIGFAQFLKFKNESVDTAYVDIIINSGNRLLKVTNNLLHFARLEADYVKVKPYKCSLNQELDKLYSEIYNGNEALKQKPIVFKKSYGLTNGTDQIFIDSFNLMEVLKRLLDNAFKYTTEGEVKLEYEVKNNNQLIFYVRDTGQGISEEKKNEVLNTSAQLQDKIHGEIKGIGLGLIIAKKLVNLMGGELNFSSEEGVGSCFYFSIPFKYPLSDKSITWKRQENNPSSRLSDLVGRKHLAS